MRILALEPYYGGSHRAFLDGWARRSRHDWTVLDLPPHHWKWRMRHAGITFAKWAAALADGGARWDVAFASDMLDLAAFRGLAPQPVRDIPAVAYFHENQLAYPVRRDEPRDMHFALTNLTTAASAEAVWFNSAFNREQMLAGLRRLLAKMPDHRCLDAAEAIPGRSRVVHPCIDPPPPPTGPRPPGTLRILWAARWEHDKGPEAFFHAMEKLAAGGVAFRLSVLGESFREVPECFGRARRQFADRIDRWGFLPDRADYLAALAEADVFVSTAEHEFFGLAAVEAVAAGARPLLPDRLAYPEVLAELGVERPGEFLYDGTPEALADRLADLAAVADRPARGADALAARAAARFGWAANVPAMDDALEAALPAR